MDFMCSYTMLQGDQLYMAVCSWYLLKTDLSSNMLACHFLQGTRNTRSCIAGHPVYPGLMTESLRL